MAVTNYYTVNGEIIGEKDGANARTDYLTDALGSVTATVDQTGAVVNTYRYKPYGALLAKTGTGADPAFTWVGAPGYRQTSRKYSGVYVRARHYGTEQAAWTAVDALWPSQAAYAYADAEPIDGYDPSGTRTSQCCCCADHVKILLDYAYSHNWSSSQQWTLAGHRIWVNVHLSHNDARSRNPDCTMQWFEAVTPASESIYGQPPCNWDGSETDMFALTDSKNCWDPLPAKLKWRTHYLCGNWRASFLDTPQTGGHKPPWAVHKDLNIRVRVSSSPGCGCKNPFSEDKFHQVIAIDSHGQVTQLSP